MNRTNSALLTPNNLKEVWGSRHTTQNKHHRTAPNHPKRSKRKLVAAKILLFLALTIQLISFVIL